MFLSARRSAQMGIKMKYYAGLDIGGTVGRMKIAAADGRIIGEFYGAGGTMNTDGFELCNEKYRTLILPILEENQLKAEECCQICIAASGIDSKRQEEECRRSFVEMGFLQESIRVYNDCEIFLHASEGPAIILVCGTGSIACARTESGEIVRCGGWGHVLSDEGSGHSLGMKVIREAANHIDGRVDCPVLYELFTERSGLKTLDEINTYINDMLMEKTQIASYAPLAEEAWERGEERALAILRESRDELLCLVRDVYRKAGFLNKQRTEPVRLMLWGSVLLKNKVIAPELQEIVKREFPEMKVLIPEKTALDTALKMAERMGGKISIKN